MAGVAVTTRAVRCSSFRTVPRSTVGGHSTRVLLGGRDTARPSTAIRRRRFTRARRTTRSTLPLPLRAVLPVAVLFRAVLPARVHRAGPGSASAPTAARAGAASRAAATVRADLLVLPFRKQLLPVRQDLRERLAASRPVAATVVDQPERDRAAQAHDPPSTDCSFAPSGLPSPVHGSQPCRAW